VIQGLVAGTLITLFSVMRPARKAARTEPIEALRQSAVEGETLTRKRIVRTIVLVAVGVIGLLFAPNGALLGIAAVVFFVGMIIAGPLIALLGSKVFKPILRRFGLEGRLAADNVGRNPQRTATTSNALLIGVFLVTLVTVAGTSLKDFAVSTIDELASADFVMVSTGGTVDDQLVADIEAIGDVERVVPFATEVVAQADAEGGMPVALSTGDFEEIADVANIQLDEGSFDDLGPGNVIVVDVGEDTPAMGSTVSYEDSAGDTAELTVVGVTKASIDSFTLGDLVDAETFDAFVGDTAPTKAFIDAKDGTQTDVEDEIEEITDLRPDIDLEAGNDLSQLIGTIFDFLINAINGLLLMSVLVALIGIVNTMSLSIIERRRELGLLRVIGMLDRRVRRMVRIESILISTLGTITGIVMGVFTGGALVLAINRLSNAAIDLNFALWQILLVLVAGVVLGYLAALIPAGRSTRPEVLEAIQVT
jgi:putative ABC transport system permease protein